MPDKNQRKEWDMFATQLINNDKLCVIERYFEENMKVEEEIPDKDKHLEPDFATSKPPFTEEERRRARRHTLGV